MKKFREYLREALEAQAGENTGFREVHKFTHKGEEHHAVVNIVHNGDGHYKVVARVGKPGKVGFKNIQPEGLLGARVAAHVKKTVDGFVRGKNWKTVTLGGINRDTKEKYQSYARDLEASDKNIRATYGNPKSRLGAAVVLRKLEPPKDITLSGMGKPSEFKGYDVKPSKGGSSGSSSGRGSREFKDEKFHPSGSKGVSGPSGPFKKKDDASSAALGAGSGASSAGK